MKAAPALLPTVLLLALLTNFSFARGGGEGFRGGGGEFRGGGFGGDDFRDEAIGRDEFRGEAPRLDGDFDTARRSEENIEGPRGDDSYRIDHDGASAAVRRDGDGAANVNVRTVNGVDYDATVVGPDGFRDGYIWRNGAYVAVNCAPLLPYVAPYGAWAGWSVVTQPDYAEYPVYSTYPVETAVEIALQKLGIYTGPIDGLATSCAGAIEQYQMQNDMPVTGTITPELLTALGIQASFQ